jgi:crotonobetainyl-CoA:carnitine CoA-transferase CaiB-like acyl-CoA transferase
MSARKENEVALDAAISAWTATRQAGKIEAELSAAGVCAAAVANFLDVYRQPARYLAERGYLVPVAHPESGIHDMPVLPWVYTDEPGHEVRHSPCFGEHSREVLKAELGITDDEYDALESRGITGTTPL